MCLVGTGDEGSQFGRAISAVSLSGGAMSTQYPVLNKRPINLWKVVELREELKKRKLTTKGLKDDLIKRLHEAIQKEMNDFQAQVTERVSPEAEDVKKSVYGESLSNNGKIVGDSESKFIYGDTNGKGQDTTSMVDIGTHITEVHQPKVQDATVGNSDDIQLVENIEVEQIVYNDKALERSEVELERECLNPSRMDTEHDASHTCSRVYDEVNTNVGSQVYFESVSTDVVSNNDMKELDDNLVSENAHVELEICKSEKLQSSASEGPPPDDVRLNLDDHMPHLAEGFVAETNKDDSVNDGADGGLSITSISAYSQCDGPILEYVVGNNPIEFDTCSNNLGNHAVLPEAPTAKNESFDAVVGTKLPVDIVKTYVVDSFSGAGSAEKGRLQGGRSTSPDVDFSKMTEDGDEKLNIDQTLDNDLCDDVVEMHDVQVLHTPDDVSEKIELTQVPSVKRRNTCITASPDSSFSKLDCSPEKMDKTVAFSEKRKARDEAAVDSEGPQKRRRSWNFENHNIPQQLGSGVPGSTIVTDDSSHTTLLKCNLLLSDSTHSKDGPKERIVPSSSKPPTNSLIIDQFLRPFTLKALQELLAKTGKVCSFWMDNIKTHCYVTYSCIEEAIETRNAVYNLEWPPNGGRLLLAEFADPDEVKKRLEETPKQQPTPAHTTTVPNTTPTQAPVQPLSSTKHKDLIKQPVRPQLPPPLPEKVDSPIIALDDLFRRTRTKPQIYYMPLTREQVVARKGTRSKRKS